MNWIKISDKKPNEVVLDNGEKLERVLTCTETGILDVSYYCFDRWTKTYKFFDGNGRINYNVVYWAEIPLPKDFNKKS